MHVLPQLRELQERFADVLVVIGVHSAKFTEEGGLPNLRQAILRHDIRHPVVNDPRYVVWQSYAVSAWPTTVIVDPEGRVVETHVGEFEAEELAPVIQAIVDESGRQGKQSRGALRWPLERQKEPERPLAFPGKVLVDAPSGRVFIADTGHHRVVVAGLDGKVQAIVGRGEPGLEDGDFETASFRSPQGLALDGEVLYVADTGNHAIRRVDLRAGRVDLAAGTGEQARLARRGGPALQTPLNSPWDIALRDGALTIAIAGSHQLWELDPAAGEMRRFAGTGREALYDDRLEKSALAQPSGLAVANGRVYFADSESSAIRLADTTTNRMQTIIGAGLFDFGDHDGRGSQARLQHPLGVAHHEGILYVADTYNNKIKRVDPGQLSSETFLGTGEAGFQDGGPAEARFWEPGGVSIADGRLYIADTNNHAIRVAELATRRASTLPLAGPGL